MKKTLCGYAAAAAAIGTLVSANPAHADVFSMTVNFTNHTACTLTIRGAEGNFVFREQPDISIGVGETSHYILTFTNFISGIGGNRHQDISYEAVNCKDDSLNRRGIGLSIRGTRGVFSYNFNDSSPGFAFDCPRGTSCPIPKNETLSAQAWEAAR
ncbi:hypothetical protein ACFWDI_40335 [Streptomyces sp. NPDC060064]|uniref:hypothetical protein n=1 Tax=Streptomyces sp. NPDC060064 TaxID=3347049 RepID=UPI0036B08228